MMMPPQPLRHLLDELHTADVARQRTPRDSPDYLDAVHRVDRLVKAVWDAADDLGPERRDQRPDADDPADRTALGAERPDA